MADYSVKRKSPPSSSGDGRRRVGLGLCIALLFAMGVVGCRPTQEHVVIDSETLVFEAIGTGQQGSMRDTLKTVVASALEWGQLAARLRPAQPFDDVDFGQSEVVVIAVPETSGGYTVHIESIEKIGDTTTVSYVVSTPGPTCITISALTLPFQAVAVQKIDDGVVFERRTETYSCAM